MSIPTIRLPNGFEMPAAGFATTMMALECLWDKGLSGQCAVSDLYELAANPRFRVPRESTEQLRGLALMQPDGSVHDVVRNVILCAYDPQDFSLSDPRGRKTVQKSTNVVESKLGADNSKKLFVPVELRDGSLVESADAYLIVQRLADAWRKGVKGQRAVIQLYEAAVQGSRPLSTELMEKVSIGLLSFDDDVIKRVAVCAFDPNNSVLQDPQVDKRYDAIERQLLKGLSPAATGVQSDWRSALTGVVSRITHTR